MTMEEKQAITILGGTRVVAKDEAAEVWGSEPSPITSIPFSLTILQECAEENREKEAEWWLVYLFGFSIKDQLEKIQEVYHDNPLRFSATSPEGLWSDREEPEGYYLINFRAAFPSTYWQVQEERIAAELTGCMRTPDALITGAAATIIEVRHENPFSIVFLNGEFSSEKGIHFGAYSCNKNGFHLGWTVTSGRKTLSGKRYQIEVLRPWHPKSARGSHIGVCVMKKP